MNHDTQTKIYTDGVVTAVFDKEAGTLTFSGNGAVGYTSQWLKYLEFKDRVFVRTIVFENGITSVGNGEFNYDKQYINLERIIFQGDINAIGAGAFYGNRNLTMVRFGGKCRAIEKDVFRGCPSIDSINIPNECHVEISI